MDKGFRGEGPIAPDTEESIPPESSPSDRGFEDLREHENILPSDEIEPSPEYLQESQPFAEALRREFGESARLAGLGEEIFSEAERRVADRAGALERSERDINKREHSALSVLREATRRKIVSWLVAGTLTVGALVPASPVRAAEASRVPTAPIEVVQLESGAEQAQKGGVARESTETITELGERVSRLEQVLNRYPTVLRELAEASPAEIARRLSAPRPPEREKLPEPRVSGFERTGTSSEGLRKFVREAFPESWVGKARNIEYLTKAKRLPERYGHAAYAAARADRESGTIRFFRLPERDQTPGEIIHSLAHELAHLNEPGEDVELTLRERLEFYEDAIGRLTAEDRFPYPAVEPIRNPDPRMELWLKAKEWWAEASGWSLSNPHFRGMKSTAKDVALVEKWTKKRNPDFNLSQFTAASERLVTRGR